MRIFNQSFLSAVAIAVAFSAATASMSAVTVHAAGTLGPGAFVSFTSLPTPLIDQVLDFDFTVTFSQGTEQGTSPQYSHSTFRPSSLVATIGSKTYVLGDGQTSGFFEKTLSPSVVDKFMDLEFGTGYPNEAIAFRFRADDYGVTTMPTALSGDQSTYVNTTLIAVYRFNDVDYIYRAPPYPDSNLHLNSFSISGSGAFQSVNPNGVFSLAVPEPISWTFMVLGFGAVGSALRRRNASICSASA